MLIYLAYYYDCLKDYEYIKYHFNLLPEGEKMVISKSTETNKESKLEYFRKLVVGLDKRVPLLDGSLKRYVNTEDVMLTLLGRYCIMSAKARPKDDHGETNLP